MDAYLTLLTVFLSGLFGLLVAVVTALLANRTDTRTYRRSRNRKRYEDTESLYVDAIATLEKCIRHTEQLDDYAELMGDLPRLNARLQLSTTKEIMDQYEVVADRLSQWSAEHRRGAPKKIPDTGMAIISSHDPPHQEKAKALYPGLMEELVKMVKLMKIHLESIDV